MLKTESGLLTMAEKEYIEREKLNDMLEDFCVNESFYDVLQTIPTADVAPVRHGHIIWKRRRRGGFRHVKCLHRFCNFVIEDNAPCKHIAKIDERYTIDEPYCSECGKLLGDFLNYCGNCGAKMDGAPYA